MRDGELLLNAIDANPEEDLPKLMYADYLEEIGKDGLASQYRRAVDRCRQLRKARIDLTIDQFRRSEEWQRIFDIRLEPSMANTLAADLDLSMPKMWDVKRIVALANGCDGHFERYPASLLDSDPLMGEGRIVGQIDYIGIFELHDYRYLLSTKVKAGWRRPRELVGTHELASNLDDIIDCALTLQQLERLGI